MKNKITDLRNHLFAQMERLNNEELTPDQLQKEIQRANAMSELGKVIVDTAKTQVIAMKVMGKKHLPTITEDAEDFVETKQIERPPAQYTNIGGHQKAMEKYS